MRRSQARSDLHGAEGQSEVTFAVPQVHDIAIETLPPPIVVNP
jgi:hypothetical protein